VRRSGLLSEALALVTSVTNALGVVLAAKGMKRFSSPSVAAFYSVLVQAAILTAISVTRLSILNWLALTYFAIGGVLSLGLARLLYFVATRSIGVARASAIVGSNPVLTAFLSIMILAEVPSISLFAGATLVVVGVFLISGAKNFRLEKAFIVGLFSSLSYSMSYIVSKMGLMIEADPVLSAEAGTLAGLLFTFSYIILTREHRSLRIDRFSLSCFAATGFVSTLGWVALMKAFEIGVVSVVTTIVYSYPLFTLFLTRSFLRDEKLSMRTVAGSVLVVVGVAVVTLLRLA
jgi:drug/metabolite transporter (DMT)-like permease